MAINIPWNNLSAEQIREVIRSWPDLPAFITDRKADRKSAIVAQAAQKANIPVQNVRLPKVKARDLKGVPTKRLKHTGADGEVKFVEHRNIWIGFFGGRAVVKRNTQEACRDALRKQFGV